MKTTSLLYKYLITICLILFLGLTKQEITNITDKFICDEKSADNITIVIFNILINVGRKCNTLHTFS